MHTVLATDTLKTGETLTIECVTSPDAERDPQILPFLAHKPPNYLGHIQASMAGNCDALETRYYIGLLEGEVVGNIMTVESLGVGIFGHVHTRTDQRRKGICDTIMRHQMEDFRRRNGHVLLLGTGYQSAAYNIYERHGFRDWTVGHPGLMRYDTEPEGAFEQRFFAPAPTTVGPARWQHWPLVALLATIPVPISLRSLALGLWGVDLLEGPYCKFFYTHGNRPETRAAVLESETDAVLALATCIPDGRWPGIFLLDVFGHPELSTDDGIKLLEALPLPDAKIQSYADPNDSLKISTLETLGFERTAILPGQFFHNDTWIDIWLYTRS